MRIPKFLVGLLLKYVVEPARKREPYGHLYIHNKLYMHRWPIFGAKTAVAPRRWWFPLCIRAHDIYSSDIEVLHDHPTAFAAIILATGYKEHVPVMHHGAPRIVQAVPRLPGDVIVRSHTDLHYLTLFKDGRGNVCPVTTIFITWRWRHVWGFRRFRMARGQLVIDPKVPHHLYEGTRPDYGSKP